MADLPLGVVYLLHFRRPLSHARHYLGFSTDLEERLRQHALGISGVKLMSALFYEGIGFDVARTWEGVTVRRERQLKLQGGRARMCPVCHPGMKMAKKPGIRTAA